MDITCVGHDILSIIAVQISKNTICRRIVCCVFVRRHVIPIIGGVAWRPIKASAVWLMALIPTSLIYSYNLSSILG